MRPLKRTKGDTSHEWIITSLHPDYRGMQIDVSDLALGKLESDNHKWAGPYTGRPGLLRDLLPAIRVSHSHLTPYRITAVCNGAVRAFWRYLDRYEEWREKNGVQLRIDSLAQLAASVVEPWALPGPSGAWKPAHPTYQSEIRRLIVGAVELAGGRSMLFAPLAQRKATPKDTATEEEGLRIIRHLRQEVSKIFAEWRRADVLAKQGRDLLDIATANGGTLPKGFETTEADAHATFRAFVKRVGSPTASVRDFNKFTINPERKSLPLWWPRHAISCDVRGTKRGGIVSWNECQSGAYPTTVEVTTIALLALARTGWNPSTLLALDYENWCAAYDEDHYWLHAVKERSGGARQYSISRRHQVTGTYQIVTRLIARGLPLRQAALSDPSRLGLLQSELSSPWLGLNQTFNRLFVANAEKSGSLSRAMAIHVENVNKKLSDEERVRAVTPSDFRDIAAAVMYRDSRYNAWILMVMLGHKNISTTRAYGFRHSARQESHTQVASVVSDVFEQVRHSKKWDPALTRAKIEGITVSDDALARLDDYREVRTYAGALCRNPYEPPSSIDPSHPKDGAARCIQGHLCVARACPNAIVLNDSLSDICKMLAELEAKRLMLGVVRFATGSEQADMEYLRRTLEQWPEESVQQNLAYWRSRISEGTHYPLMFAGQR